jgi:hypothetical protein
MQSKKYVFPDSRKLVMQQIPKQELAHLAKLQLVSYTLHAALEIISFIAHTHCVYKHAGAARA